MKKAAGDCTGSPGIMYIYRGVAAAAAADDGKSENQIATGAQRRASPAKE